MRNDLKLPVAFVVCSLLCIAMAFWSCNDTGGDDPLPARMELLNIPTEIPSNLDTSFICEIRISGENIDVDSIVCTVTAPGGSQHSQFSLFDDGGNDSLWGPEYAGHVSGDIAPNNGKFTRFINGQLLAAGTAGNYVFRFTPIGNIGGLQPQSVNVTIADVNACVITSITHVHALPACFSEFTLDVQVRPDRPDVVDSVRLLLLLGEDELGRINFSPHAGDSVWRATMDPTFMQCVGSRDDYIFYYEAITRFGLMCSDSFHGVDIQNYLPVLSNTSVPDTVFRPTEAGRVDTFDTFITFNDCELQGEEFYYGIHYSVRREDRVNWSDSSVFIMRDDGLAHDAVAGDGRFTAALTVDRQDGLPNFLYYFRYYAIECAPPYDSSESVYDSVRIIQPGALVMPPPDELGLNAGFGR